MEFKPNEARDFVTTGVQAKATLAPALGAVTAFNVGTDLKTGEVQAAEIGKQLPGQMAMVLEDTGDEEDPMVRTVDPSTGEIYETPASNVIDLRKTRQA